MSISAEELAQMSRVEKLRLIELIWEDLSRHEATADPPSWHEEELRKTRERLAAGKEQPVDWEVAKRELRKLMD